MSPERRGDINRLAAMIVDTLGLTAPIDINAVVDGLGGRLRIVSDEDELGVAKDGNRFVLHIDESSNGNRRFAVAHQLGHLFLHLGYLVNPELWESSTGYEDSVLRRFDFSREEEEANEFASALLMPKEAFMDLVGRFSENGECKLPAISNALQVQSSSVVHRGRNLGVFAS